MRAFFNRPGVVRFRRIFRGCRMAVWLVLLFIVGALAYLHLVGLPDFLKAPLLRRLQEHGIAAQFTKMQLGWSSGPAISIENAAFSHADDSLSPRLTTAQAELSMNWNAMRHGRIELRSLQVSDAQLRLPISPTNGDLVLLSDLNLKLQFASNDFVRVSYCRGIFRGVQIDLIGQVAHVQDLQNWKLPGPKNTNATVQYRLEEVADTLEKISFTGKPVLSIEAGADGRDMNSFHAEMEFAANSGHTPWGDAKNLAVSVACARLLHPGRQPFLRLKWSASSMETPWGGSRKISFATSFSRAADSNLDTQVHFDAAQLRLPLADIQWFRAAHLSWNGMTVLAASNFVPLQVSGKLQATLPQTPSDSAREISLDCKAVRNPDQPASTVGWGKWDRLAPWQLDWQTEMHNVVSPKLRVDQAAFAGKWRAPLLAVENLRAQLYGGSVKANASLDIQSRELRSSGTSDLDPHAVSQLFDPSVSNWLAQLDWTAAPKINAGVRVVLAPWTNCPPDWHTAVDKSLQLGGDFTVGPSSFLTMPATSASGHVTYTNQTWHVSNLRAFRPEGYLDLDYTSSLESFLYIIDSHIFPAVTTPLFPPGRKHVLDELSFTQPPHIQTRIWGSWQIPDSTGFSGSVQATNFVARGEHVAALRAEAALTNDILTVKHLSASNELSQVHADWMQADFGTKIISLTNVAGVIDPALVERAFRKNPPDFLKVIHFDAPPSVSVAGTFSLTNAAAVNLQFLVNGQHLHYSKFVADKISGEVDYVGPAVILTNISGSLYNKGTLLGWLTFVTKADNQTDFRANLTVKNIDIAPLGIGLAGKNSHLEGRLDGDLDLRGPNSAEEENKWHGVGRLHLYDGLIWDLKIFGLFSPVLNLFSPGWGYDRAREASADFVMANGVVSSDDCEIRFTGFVLKLRGTVNTKEQINARLEAVLSRQTPLVGSLLSLAFTPLSKLLEYQITGTVNDPVPEPIYVPKFIRVFLHPIKSMKAVLEPNTPPAQAAK